LLYDVAGPVAAMSTDDKEGLRARMDCFFLWLLQQCDINTVSHEGDGASIGADPVSSLRRAVNWVHSTFRSTTLMRVAKYGTAVMIRSLLSTELVADINRRDSKERTAAHWLMSNDRLMSQDWYDLIHELHRRGVDFSVADSDGVTPMHVTCRLQPREAIWALASIVDVEPPGGEGPSCRTKVAGRKRNRTGESPRNDEACNDDSSYDEDHPPCPCALKAFNAKDRDGNTPITIAIMFNHRLIKADFVSMMASVDFFTATAMLRGVGMLFLRADAANTSPPFCPAKSLADFQ
jgi:ankyrin repeat protein